MKPEKVYAAARRNTLADIWAHLPFFRDVGRGNILEIGVHRGLSTSAFLLGVEQNGGHVYSVDVDPRCRKLFHKHPQWTFFCVNSQDSAGLKAALNAAHPTPDSFEVLFIDGSHDEPDVKNDLRNYALLVKAGGLILMHDVQEPADKSLLPLSGWAPGQLVGPRRAFDEFTQLTGWKSEIHPESWGLGVIHVPRGAAAPSR
ncbi:MAG: class I SAM-dependent methyltransferase [Candidatus Acidiferrales bacterium]